MLNFSLKMTETVDGKRRGRKGEKMAAEGMKKTIWLPIKGAFSDLVIWRSVICCRILEEYPSGVRVTCQLVTDTNTPAGKKERDCIKRR